MQNEMPAHNARRCLVFVKAAYFLYVGGRSVLVSFIVVFLAYIGLNPVDIGIIRGVQPFVCFLFSPVIGMISDRFGIHKQVILLGTAAMGLFCFSTAFLPSHHTEEELMEDIERSDYQMFTRRTGIPLYLEGADHQMDFYLAIILIALSDMCNIAVVPIMDSNTESLVRQIPKCSYGQQRLWGSIGAVILLPITGLMLDLINKNSVIYHEYFPGFVLYIACILLSMFLWCYIPVELGNARRGERFNLAHVKTTFRNPSFLMFLLVAFALGVTASQDTAKYLLLEELNASHLNRSLCIVFNCLAEVPLMWYSKAIIDRLGAEVVFSLVILAWVIRLVLYSFLCNPWSVLPVELLNGVCFGLWWPAVTSYCKDSSSGGFAVSVLAVANALHNGIGLAVGSLSGGFIYRTFGPRILFRGVACMNLLLLAVYLTFLRFHEKRFSLTCMNGYRSPPYTDREGNSCQPPYITGERTRKEETSL